MKEVLLITAPWCHSCHAMQEWFFTIEIPGVSLKILDAEDPGLENESISSVPVIIFKDGGATVQTITGALGKSDLISRIHSFWPET
jgi:thiol-disulfide isomerase/thioredoxin